MMLFKTWGYITMTQALSITSGMFSYSLLQLTADVHFTRLQAWSLHEGPATTYVLVTGFCHRGGRHHSTRRTSLDVY